jgi:hypothetical protein
LEVLEDRLALTAPVPQVEVLLPALNGFLQGQMAIGTTPSISHPETDLAGRAAIQSFLIGGPSNSIIPPDLINGDHKGFSAIGPSVQSESSSNAPLSLPEVASMAQGMALAESRYLLVAILIPGNLSGPNSTINPGLSPGDETFASFLPRAQLPVLAASNGKGDPFLVLTGKGRAEVPDWLTFPGETKPVRQGSAADTPDRTEAGPDRSKTASTSDALDHKKENPPDGPAVPVLSVVPGAEVDLFADPKLLPACAPAGLMQQDGQGNPQLGLDLRWLVLAVALTQNTEPDQRKRLPEQIVW